jgi:hypothetical protein
MSKKSDLIKKLVKTNVGEKSTFGTNPSDPWSAKANIAEESINETALLNRYLKSRGINPEFVNKDQKVSHSKTNQFKIWAQAHINDPIREQVDRKDTVTFDIPLLIRVLEYAREDIKSDIDLHKVVEKLIHIRKKGVLTMKDYIFITRLREDFNLDENHIAIAMGNMMDDEGSMVLNQLEQLERSIEMIRSYVGKDYEKQLPAWIQAKITLASDYIDTAGNYLASKNEKVNEAKEANYDGSYQDSVRALKAKAEKKPVDTKSLADRMQASYRRDNEKNKQDVAEDKGTCWTGYKRKPGTNKFEPGSCEKIGENYDDNRTGFAKKPREDDEGYSKPKFKAKDIMDRPHTVHIDGKPWKKFDTGHQAHAAVNTLGSKGKKAVAIAHFKENLEPMAACNQPGDGANTPDDTVPANKKGQKLIQMSKSAKLVKDIYKQKSMKEETYDHEKEDKSVATYGKKPKLQNPNTDVVTKEEPKAAAILTGGKTLTGEPRDTIEIDPMMKMRKPSPNSQKSN